jgi:bacteriocin biosynthesis cyclodehydratase domain-containing protein
MLSRPLLKPGVRQLWRDPGTLQLGVDPRHAVVLTGLAPGDRDLLDLLDGTRDRGELIAAAQRFGQPVERVGELIATLAAAGALDDSSTLLAATRTPELEPDLLALSARRHAPGAVAATLTARSTTEVEVLGAGRVGATLATLLQAAGIGRLVVHDSEELRPADLAPGGSRRPAPNSSSREAAARIALAELRPASRPPVRSGAVKASIVVLAPSQSVIPPEWLRQVRARAHLPVVMRDNLAVIGPLVIPGRTPCLRCLELARADRDPVWPVIAAQLIGRVRQVEPCDVVLATAAAAHTAMQLLGWLDDPAAPTAVIGGTLEISLGDGTVRRQRLTGHPGCGCGADQPLPATG